MKTLRIIFLISIIIKNAYAATEFNVINTQKIRDLSFELSSKSYGDLLFKKLMLNKKEDLKIQFFWSVNHKLEGEFISHKDVENIKLKENILKVLTEKLQKFLFENYVENLKNYKKTSIAQNSDEYRDQSSTQVYSKVLIENKKYLKIINQYGSDVTEETKLFYKMYPWSQNLKVLDKVIKSSSDHAQSTLVKTNIEYAMMDENWFPKYLKVSVVQTLKMTRGPNKTLERVIEEDLSISNVMANKNKALMWFSKRK